MTSRELLDTEELLHLALQATGRQDSGSAIEYLKRLLDAEPGHPRALYLLGAHEAQIGLMGRAIEHMAAALQAEPTLDVARFQLGWLQLNAGDTPAAEATWRPLEALGDTHPLRSFKQALLHLSRDELPACLQALDSGISHDTPDSPLASDMAALAQRVRQRAQDSVLPGSATSAGTDTEVPSMFLDAYTRRTA